MSETSVSRSARQPLDERLLALSQADLDVIRGHREPRATFDNGFDNGFDNSYSSAFDNGFDNSFNTDSLRQEARPEPIEADDA
jgi:hypothetical protein